MDARKIKFDPRFERKAVLKVLSVSYRAGTLSVIHENGGFNIAVIEIERPDGGLVSFLDWQIRQFSAEARRGMVNTKWSFRLMDIYNIMLKEKGVSPLSAIGFNYDTSNEAWKPVLYSAAE